ncbi:MAG: hypothetical protein O2807_13150 [bacterium]|nr:hypothetical protein [bacterium]
MEFLLNIAIVALTVVVSWLFLWAMMTRAVISNARTEAEIGDPAEILAERRRLNAQLEQDIFRQAA